MVWTSDKVIIINSFRSNGKPAKIVSFNANRFLLGDS
jgi:hypothetical protein